MHARIKLSAVGMRNAILGNDLNAQASKIDIQFKQKNKNYEWHERTG